MSVDTHNAAGGHPGVLLEQPQERDERPTKSLLRDGGGAQVFFGNKIFFEEGSINL